MKKTIWIITLFPEYFKPLMGCGVLGKALRGERGAEDFRLEVKVLNLRDFSDNNYKGVDDSPFGGGAGMVMRADILKRALVEGVGTPKEKLHVVFPCPRGKVWNGEHARQFGKNELYAMDKDLVFICGRYEGVDERFLEKYVDEFISLGDFVLTGGELAVMSILDSAMRFVPGVLGNKLSAEDESFQDGLLEYPQYTRPRDFEGMEVPEVLLNGHHQKIIEYQASEKKRMTKKFRPDLWEKYES